MNKIIQFFKDIRAVFKLFGKLIYQDVLVEELGYPQKEQVYSYTMGNELVNELIQEHLTEFIEKHQFELKVSSEDGFYLQNEKFYIQIVDQRFDGLELWVFVRDYNTKVSYEMWNELMIDRSTFLKIHNSDKSKIRLGKQMLNYVSSIEQAISLLKNPNFMEKYRNSETRFWRN